MVRAMAGQSETAKKLKELRARAGLTVTEAAFAAGVRKSTYAYYEDDFKKEHLPIGLLQKLAPAFAEGGVKAEELLKLGGIDTQLPAEISSLKKSIRSTTDEKVIGMHTKDAKNTFSEVHGPVLLTIGERDLKVLGAARGGERGFFLANGEAYETISRPGNLIGVMDAYAVYMVGDSMFPRYKSGWTLCVNPNKPVRKEHNVVVQLQASEHAEREYLVKEFVRRDEKNLVLRQLNPPKELRFPAKSVVAIHRITSSIEDN